MDGGREPLQLSDKKEACLLSANIRNLIQNDLRQNIFIYFSIFDLSHRCIANKRSIS
jgi:hypothetical protein